MQYALFDDEGLELNLIDELLPSSISRKAALETHDVRVFSNARDYEVSVAFSEERRRRAVVKRMKRQRARY